jgi:thymidylate kinase
MKNILEKVFESVNNAGLEYVILRKYDSLPDGMGDGDIDVLVSFKDVQRLRSILTGMNFLIVSDIYPHTFAFFFDETQGELIKFDIVDRFAFGTKLIAPFPKCYEQTVLGRRIRNKAFYVPSPEDEMILLFLHCLGDRGFFDPDYKERLQGLVARELDTRYMIKLLDRIFGRRKSHNVLPWIRKGRFDQLIKLRRQLGVYLARQLNRKGLLAVITILKQRGARRILGRRGLRIALMGPDGSGKTTLARNIKDRGIFNTKYVYMGRDQFVIPTRRILKFIGNDLRKNSEGSVASQPSALFPTEGRIRDIIDVGRFLHDLIDFYVRYFLRNYLYYRKGFLVVNDRYIYDMLTGGEKLVQLPVVRQIFSRLVPAPDRMFFLDAPSTEMYARKSEHSVEVLDAMRRRYSSLSRMMRNCQSIQTGKNADEVANSIIAYIWKEYYCNLGKR